MLKTLSIFIYFLRELVFDSKDEYDFKSSKFNTRKFIIFVFILLSISANFYIIIKAFKLAGNNIVLQKQISQLKEENKLLDTERQICVETINTCEKFKSSYPSNEGKYIIPKNKGNNSNVNL